jgi:hypothetical protein
MTEVDSPWDFDHIPLFRIKTNDALCFINMTPIQVQGTMLRHAGDLLHLLSHLKVTDLRKFERNLKAILCINA